MSKSEAPPLAPEQPLELNRTAKVMLADFTPEQQPPAPRSILSLLHQLQKRRG